MSVDDAPSPVRPPTGRPRLLLWTIAGLLLFLGLGAFGYRWASHRALAVLTEFSGAAQRDHAGSQGKWQSAEKGDEFDDGDGAKTPLLASALFRLASHAKLTLKPASQIRFQRRSSGRGAIGLTVEVGEADVRTANGTLTLTSQFGEVLIEPNSLVRLKRSGAQLMLSVEVGGLELSSPKQGGRSLKAGQTLMVSVGGIVVDSAESAAKAAEKVEDVPSALEQGDGISRSDLIVPAGQSFVVHDPAPPTAIGFTLSALCKGPARLTSGKLMTEASGQANLSFPTGKHRYEVVCLGAGENQRRHGEFSVLRDSGTKRLPTFTPTANVATDGRTYTVLYQTKLPRVTVAWPGAPSSTRFHLEVDGKTHTTAQSFVILPALAAGIHRLRFSAEGTPERSSRVTTVTVQYDHQAPTAQVGEPTLDPSRKGSLSVTGQALPGWSVSVLGKDLELDAQRKFKAEISASETLPIAFSHPTRGIHYYLRRPSRAPSSPTPR